MRTDASASSGYVRSTSRPSTTPASAAFASRGEIPAATSRTDVPAGTLRLEPSGNVMLTLIASGTSGKLEKWKSGKVEKWKSGKVSRKLKVRAQATGSTRYFEP